MTLPLVLLLAVFGAQAEPYAAHYRSPYAAPPPAPSQTYPGAFVTQPVPHFAMKLPGNGSSRAERAKPVIAGTSIFVGSANAESLFELDRSSGAVRHVYPAAAAVQSEPLVVGGHVFFGDTGGRIWSYAIGKDEPIWSYDTAAPVLVQPSLANGRIFATNVDDLTVALDAVDGKMLWRHKQRQIGTRRAELSLFAAPPAIVVGDTVYAGYHDGTLVALATDTGDVRWTLSVGSGRYPDLVAAPTAWDGMVFASGYFEPLLAIDATTHKVLWSLPHGAADQAIVVELPDGPLLLHPGTDGKLRGIRPRSGEIAWTWDSGDSAAIVRPIETPLGVLVGSTAGTLWLVDPASGEATWRFSPPYVIEGLAAAPTIEGRQLVFTTNAGKLYSLLSPLPSPGDVVARPTPLPALSSRKKRAPREREPQTDEAPVDTD